MNFIIFRDFSDFFSDFIFDFKPFLNKKIKNKKMGLFFVRGHVDATWQSRPHGSATWTHVAPTRHIIHLYLYSLSYIYSIVSLLYIERVFDLHMRRVL